LAFIILLIKEPYFTKSASTFLALGASTCMFLITLSIAGMVAITDEVDAFELIEL
jgi:hypothetical protein